MTETVSILLVTKNGARYLAELLDGVKRQEGRFQLAEIIAVDSGSRDVTLDILRCCGARVVQIPPQEFGHGKTRNLAASHAAGDYLVFMTQDATPADTQWLANLLAPLQADPTVAGAFSRHLPRPHCHPMEWRRIVEMEPSGRPESRVNSARDNPDYVRNPAYYYFFANVSSVLRQRVWQQFPFPEVEFGEDQRWARQVLEVGYRTAYCADSLVYHSHGYGPWANFCRHFDHARAFPAGSYQLRLKDAFRAASAGSRQDLAFWRRLNGQSKSTVVRQWGLTALGWHLAAYLGTWLGERARRLPQGVADFFSYQEQVRRG